tara:strand:- start:173 stop:325 length:153 start_codon:yes stop_codon:yes gene_type:complete
MLMDFDSFILMDGNGPYVWSCLLLLIFILAINYFFAARKKKKLFHRIKTK